MNVLLLLAHSIEEHDQVKLLSELGYDVFSIGAYVDPRHPSDPKRPALPDAPWHPELAALVEGDQMAHKADLPDGLLAWADVVIVHHFETVWIAEQWRKLREFVRGGGRVIWRTVGQSGPFNERVMAPLRDEGLEIVRYSPKERAIPDFAGEDALIRFWKDPDEWTGWTGEAPVVINVTQHLLQRGDFTNWRYWESATRGLPRTALGPGSEVIEGTGELAFDEMQAWLRRARCYLYTGTQPASYTLGLIEALMTGTPIVSIGASWMRNTEHGPLLFEGHELAEFAFDDPSQAFQACRMLLGDLSRAKAVSVRQRARAIELFGKDAVAAQWRAFLGDPATVREPAEAAAA